MTPSAYPPFDVQRFEAHRSALGTLLGRPCHYHAITGSTNDDLMRLARNGAPHGTVVVADLQTRGRGRHGNTWSSPEPAENLLFSVLLRPRFALESASSFTLAVGLAVRDAVAPYVRAPVGIKWTNDVYASHRKLAGILVESQLRGSELMALVVGIGLNVHMSTLPDEIRTIATSLRLLEATELGRERLLADVLARLETRALAYEQTQISGIIDELRRHDAILGQQVRVGALVGMARGLDDDGALLLETDPERAPLHLTTGLVEVMTSSTDAGDLAH
jgi:BirA family biotin operon repressor/biotin-[acetyl-CoA-carboxylase] ligase